MRFFRFAALLVPVALQAQRPATFRLEETSIAKVHEAFKAKTLTCHRLVQRYLDRIAAYDKSGPAINAIVTLNSNALAVADSLDKRFATAGLIGPLHCIPMIVKDNFETLDLQTTAGSLALKGWIPKQDATQVARVRAAGAIVLAKSNLAEWAFTPFETVSSILPGYTKNPYALDRVTAGSSGGTAAAVAANEGEVGLGSDTGNSIRGPSAHNALVGIRSTMGLTSRAGVVPLNNGADIAGPMARTVADAVAVFNVVAGSDAADPVTEPADAHREKDYNAFVKAGGLKGARIGILRQAYERTGLDSEVVAVFTRAVDALKKEGATIVDPAGIDSLNAVTRAGGGGCNPFKYDLERYLAARAPNAPVHTIKEVLRSGNYHPTVQLRLQMADTVSVPPEDNPGCKAREAMRERFRTAVRKMMDSLNLDALVYPTWSNPPRLIGDLNTPAGDNSQLFSPTTGFPAITVPMGYTRRNTLPAGMTFFGRPWSEGKLITLAYGFEQATHHRKAPASAPELNTVRQLSTQSQRTALMAPHHTFARYVAIGDSSTEGLEDPNPDGSYRGWANRFAEHVAAAQSTPLLYANLAVRGRQTRGVRDEQLAPALAMQPDLATVFAGVNDVARGSCDVPQVAADLEAMFAALRAQGATVLTITMPDLSAVVPLAKLMRERLLKLNDLVRAAAERTGTICIDLDRSDVTRDLRLWHPDRLHANTEGHRRIALALAAAVGAAPNDDAWAAPLPPRRPPSAIERAAAEWVWARDYFFPWVWRHARGISSGDGRTAKRPTLEPIHPLAQG